MGSCTSKGVPNSRQSSRKVSKTDFHIQESEFPPHILGQEKSSHNTTAHKILLILPSNEHSTSRVNPLRGNANSQNNYTPGNEGPSPKEIKQGPQQENNEIMKDDQSKSNDPTININPKRKSDGKDPPFQTQNTHTDCDVQFTSFELQPRNIPKGSFVGTNNLSESVCKNSHRDFLKQGGIGSFSQKKAMKEYFGQSKSDKKSKAGNKKNSVFSISSQEATYDLEDKKLSFSCIPLLKVFHSTILSKNQQNFSRPPSPSKQRSSSIFDILVAKATGKTFEIYDEQVLNFFQSSNIEFDFQNLLGGNNLLKRLSKESSFGLPNDFQLPIHQQLEQKDVLELPLTEKVTSNKMKKPDLKINDLEESVVKINNFALPTNKINSSALTDRDRTFLLKYAKNWQQLGRQFALRSEQNDTLSCLLAPCQLYSAIGYSDHLVVVLAEAYISFMLLVCSPRQQDTSEMHLKKAEQKFNFIRNLIISSSIGTGLLPKLNYLPSQQQQQNINQVDQPPQLKQQPQQEPSQKNTEKTFFFDEWRSTASGFASQKERSSNELILFLDMLLISLRPQEAIKRNLSFGLSSFTEIFKPCEYHSPFIHSIFSDLQTLELAISKGKKDVVFENRETHALLELNSIGGVESICGQNFHSLGSSMRRLISECGEELLLRFVEEACKGDEPVSLKQNMMSESMLKLGHLLRLWLDFSQIALFFYEQAFQEDQQNSQALFYCALTLRDLEKTPEAIQYYNQALQIDHYYTECYLNLGTIYLQEYSNIEVSEKFYIKALISSSYSSSITTVSSVQKGKIYNLLGEIHKQRLDLSLASVFYACGVQKDALYEENYYDIIEAIDIDDADSKDAKDYFRIIIDLVSFSLFEKDNWKQELDNYSTRLRFILKKLKKQKKDPSSLMILFEQSANGEDEYLSFIQIFKQSSFQESQSFIRKCLESTITLNIKEISELFAVRSLHEQSSTEDMPYIAIVRDTLNEFAID